MADSAATTHTADSAEATTTTISSKSCLGCGVVKPLSAFSNNKRYRKGKESRCKDCHRERNKKNAEGNRKAQLKWRAKNPDYYREYNKTEQRKAYAKAYYAEHKEENRLRSQKYRELYPKRYRERRQQHNEKNRDRVNAYHRQWKKVKRQNDVEYVLKENMSRRIRTELNAALRTGVKKDQRTVAMIGTTMTQLKCYLEGRFEIGMSWANYVVPCCSWTLTCPLQSALCWHYRNLSPLWAAHNQRKKDKVDERRRLYYTTYMKTVLFGL
ncbi:hypothetical protein EBZ80_13265 [bacterium]|nr:hypothetical protein [bacterium]